MKSSTLNNPFIKFGLSVLKGSIITVISVFATIGIVIAISTFARAGSLTPPGAPGATMQTLTTLYAQVDSAYSACYVSPTYLASDGYSYGCFAAPNCASGFTQVTTFTQTCASGYSGGWTGINGTSKLCCLAR